MAQEGLIRNILFDLGGVILDIDFQLTVKAFYDLGFPAELLQYPNSMGTDVYYRYESGQIDTEQFKQELKERSGVNISDEDFHRAWTALILRIPQAHIELLDKLRRKFNLYMLSNTSDLHVQAWEQMYERQAGKSIYKVFDRIYYSHEIGFRKPDHGAWKHVLEDARIKPEETLYLDDLIQNVKAAQELGFQAIHIHERTTLTDLGFDL